MILRWKLMHTLVCVFVLERNHESSNFFQTFKCNWQQTEEQHRFFNQFIVTSNLHLTFFILYSSNRDKFTFLPTIEKLNVVCNSIHPLHYKLFLVLNLKTQNCLSLSSWVLEIHGCHGYMQRRLNHFFVESLQWTWKWKEVRVLFPSEWEWGKQEAPEVSGCGEGTGGVSSLLSINMWSRLQRGGFSTQCVYWWKLKSRQNRATYWNKQ